MRIAFPTMEPKGLESEVFSHFGSAATFVIVDTDTQGVESKSNSDLNHIHGQCQPITALGGAMVDAVVVGGIGRGALMKMNAAGIRVFRAVEGTVRDNLGLAVANHLPEITPLQTCAGHGHDGGCAH